MIQWGNEQVPTNVYNAAVNAGRKYGKDAAQQKTITNTLLGIGKYESGWRYNAEKVDSVEASYGWLQFNRGRNGATGFGTPYSPEQLLDPQLEADVAAEHIARNLNSGVSLFDSLWPWTNTRVRGLTLAGINATTAGVSSGTANNTPTTNTPNTSTSSNAGGFQLPNPLGGLDAVGKFFADIENNSKRLAATGIAVVLVVGGLFIIGKGVTKNA